MDKEIYQIIEKDNKSKTEQQIVENSELFLDRLSELRNQDTGVGWSDIAKSLSKEFKMTVNPQTIQKRYIDESAMEIQIDAYAEKQFTKYIGKMAERYERLIRINDKMSKAAELVIDKITNEDIDSANMEELLLVVKLIKQVEPLLKTTLQQLEFVREEQDKIKATLSRNRKELSDDDIRGKIKNYLPEILERYEVEGKIRINDKGILKKW